MPIVWIVVLLALALVAAGVLVWLTASIVGLLLTLFIAGLVGWIADQLVPGQLPWGWAGAILAGLLGSVIGALLIGRVGPTIFRIPIVPALAGAVIVAFLANWLFKRAGSSSVD